MLVGSSAKRRLPRARRCGKLQSAICVVLVLSERVSRNAWHNTGRCWGAGRPGGLQSTGSQRLGHDGATERQPRPAARRQLLTRLRETAPKQQRGARCTCDFGAGEARAIKDVFLQSLVKPSLVTRRVVTMKDFRAFLDMRRYKNWAYQVSSWEDLSCQFPGAQRARFLLSTLISFSGGWRSAAAGAHDLILVEADASTLGGGHSLTVINLTVLWEAFRRPFATILCHFARRAHSWVCKDCRQATRWAVTGLSLSTVTEDSGPAVLPRVGRSGKTPACSVLPYLELHYHNRWSHANQLLHVP